MGRQALPQIQKKGHGIAAAKRVARTQPELRHQPHFGQHRQQRMQARLESQPSVTGRDAFLMAVLVQESGRIQIQRVAFLATGQPI
jgi:hypothetical protein